MKFYTFGDKANPAFMTFPGTICYWSAGFDAYFEELSKRFYVVAVSYDGFDETEDTIYPDMQTEAEKVEEYVRRELGGKVFCAYGCSLGGSYVAYLAQRKMIHFDHIILGSSDMDQASAFSARLQAKLVTGMLHGMLKTGKLPGFMQKLNEKQIQKDPSQREYRERFMSLFFSRDMSFVKKESVYNQFYSDLVTPIEDGLTVPGTTIHVFYAKKMGEQYLERYRKHFPQADIRTHDAQHEEVFACRPQQWLQEVYACCGMTE